MFSQFAGTSLWFAGNAILVDLAAEGNPLSIGWATSLVQLGFIAGTLAFAIFSLADRFPPSRVFFVSSLLACISCLVIIPFPASGMMVGGSRLLTGFFLAGIYPVGMKIASDWYGHDLGRALGFLLAALVLGTGFPHLLRAGYFRMSWENILIAVSLLAAGGGFVIRFIVKDGPRAAKMVKAGTGYPFRQLFRDAGFRKVALGYFGHMWELYAFWAFIPVMLMLYGITGEGTSLWSFLVIAGGALGCVVGGFISVRVGSAKVAFMALGISATCCLGMGLLFPLPDFIFLTGMLAWGFSVVADSPQFSTMVAQTAPPAYKGTALSLVTSIGFAVSIVSISFVETILQHQLIPAKWLGLMLLPGPLLGLFAMKSLVKNKGVSL